MSPSLPPGFGLALLGAGAWGVWSLFTKLATRTGSPAAVLVVSSVASAAVAVAYLLTTPATLSMAPRDLGWAAAAGASLAVGSVFYYTGLSVGDVSVVSTVTALYFVVSVVLGVLVLNEVLTPRKGAGVLLAVVAVGLLSG